MHDERNKCPFCDGNGHILEDKDAYFYYSPILLHQINLEKNKTVRDEKVRNLKNLKGRPMQPMAVLCPKCNGTGRRV